MEKFPISQGLNSTPRGATLESFSLTVSFFNSKTDKTPQVEKHTWAGLCELLKVHEERAAKDGRLISGAEYPPGAARKNENVSRVSLLILDFDGATDLAAIESYRERLNNGAGAAALIHSTFSHNPPEGAEKYRLFVPLAAPVDAAQYPEFWRRAFELCDGKPDESAKDAARMHYLPACPSERREFAVCKVYEGAFLDAATLPPCAPKEAVKAPIFTAPLESIGADKYAQKAFENELANIGSAANGSRNNTLNKAALKLGHFVGAGRLDRSQVEEALSDAARAIGLEEGEIKPTIRSGLETGIKEPNHTGLPKERPQKRAAKPTQSNAKVEPLQSRASLGYPLGLNLTDTGNAERFAAQHRESVRFCYSWNEWIAWNGQKWTRDAAALVERLAKETVRSMYLEAGLTANDDARAQLTKHATKSESRKARADFLALARSEAGIEIEPEELDAKPMLLNFQNGTLDLETGEFSGHRREDFLTQIFPVVFDPEATAPTWEKAVAQWLPDEQTRAFVQDAVGASFCGVSFDDFWMFLYGGGDNGKSTFTQVLQWLFGSYWYRASAETFMDNGRGKSSGTASPELVSMCGKRLVTVMEIDQKHKLNEALIKDLTGRDSITARALYSSEITFKPQFTLWMFGNCKPAISDTSAGMWRRVRVIPFDQKIPANLRTARYEEELKKELSGILNWALIGLARVIKRKGFEVPEEVKLATNAYRRESDPLAQFLSEKCELAEEDEGAFVSCETLWEKWVSFCKDNSFPTNSQNRFSRELKRFGVKDDRKTIEGKQRRIFKCVLLKEAENEPF